MRCDNCGRSFSSAQAVVETHQVMTGPAGYYGAPVEMRRLTLCPQCAKRRSRFRWWPIGFLVGIVILAVSVGLFIGAR